MHLSSWEWICNHWSVWLRPFFPLWFTGGSMDIIFVIKYPAHSLCKADQIFCPAPCGMVLLGIHLLLVLGWSHACQKIAAKYYLTLRIATTFPIPCAFHYLENIMTANVLPTQIELYLTCTDLPVHPLVMKIIKEKSCTVISSLQWMSSNICSVLINIVTDVRMI